MLISVVRHHWNCLDKPVVVSGLKPSLTDFGSHHKLESYVMFINSSYLVIIFPHMLESWNVMRVWSRYCLWPEESQHKVKHLKVKRFETFLTLSSVKLIFLFAKKHIPFRENEMVEYCFMWSMSTKVVSFHYQIHIKPSYLKLENYQPML